MESREQRYHKDIEDLRKKKIAVLGFSIEGLSTAKFLERHNIRFSVLERNDPSDLLPEAQEFLETRDQPLFTGPKHLDRLSEFDLVSRSQGIPLWNPKVIEAKDKGVEFTSTTKLFFEFCSCPIIGITGTKGKGTTATLIYEMLKISGFNVYLGGNIGQSPLDFIDKLKTSSWAVLELSSFQLEDLDKSPHIAVVLMVTQEHLNSQAKDSPNYHISASDYLGAKKNIVRFQDEEDYAVINADFPNSLSFVKETKSKVIRFSTEKVLPEGAYLEGDNLLLCVRQTCHRLSKKNDIFLRGEHNLQNVLAAAAVSYMAGVGVEGIEQVIKAFKGLEHRLEFVREVNGVRYYNDSFSTTPETAIAAIKSFTEPEVLILGGSDKGSDYSELGRVVVRSSNVRAVIIIGTTASKIETAIRKVQVGVTPQKGVNPIFLVGGGSSIGQIVRKAKGLSQPGDVVLLSPACASFDMFKNYKDRGRQFKDCVSQL